MGEPEQVVGENGGGDETLQVEELVIEDALDDPHFGGMSGSAHGAGFSAGGHGPTSSDAPPNPSHMTPEQLALSAAHDHPIQHDPLGQGLVSGLATGAAGLAHAAGDAAASLGHAVVETGASIAEGVFHGVVEDTFAGGHGSSTPSDAGAPPQDPHPGEDDPPDATVPDATVPPRP